MTSTLEAQIALRHVRQHPQERPRSAVDSNSPLAAQIAMRHAGRHPHGHSHPRSGHHVHGKPPVPTTAEEHHQQLVEQSEKWVAQTFYGQLLKQMHESPFKNAKFEGGRGGEAFGQMFDQRLADGMSKGAGSTLVNSMVKRIERGEAKKAYRKQSAALDLGAIQNAETGRTMVGKK